MLSGGLFALPVALLLTSCWRSHGPARPSADGERVPFVAGDGAADAPPVTSVEGGPGEGGFDASVDGSAPPIVPPPLPARCDVELLAPPFEDPVLEFRWPTGPIARADAVHVCTTPAVADLDTTDGDEEPSVVFVSYPDFNDDAARYRLDGETFGDRPIPGLFSPSGVLRIVEPSTGETITHPSDETAVAFLAPTGHVALADLDGDGRVEIVAVGRGSGTYAFRNDGSLWWFSPYPLAMDLGGTHDHQRALGPAPTIADLEGDGTPEVVVGRVVLDGPSGALRWRGDEATGRGINSFLGPISCVADLDGDGKQEVVTGPTVFRSDGSIAWNRLPDIHDGFCAVADVLPTHDGPEVVLVSRGYLYLLAGSNGRTLWWRNLEGRIIDGIGGPPTVADFDGDGAVEVGVAHGGAYGVYDPECVRYGEPAGCLASGLLWKTVIQDGSSAGSAASVFDFNGDGQLEVVYHDERFFLAFDASDGTTLFRRESASRTRTEYPIVADVDDDGSAEIVFGASSDAWFTLDWWTPPGLEIWGDARSRWVGTRPIWNQHAYHVTNIEEDGSVPHPEVPSWTMLNAYRQNPSDARELLAAPDLWGGRGRARCAPDGSATLRVEVANWGLAPVEAGVVVGFYEGRPSAGGRRLGEARTERPLAPRGDSVEVRFRLARPDPSVVYWALLDDPTSGEGGDVTECLEDNNEVWVGPFDCPRP